MMKRLQRSVCWFQRVPITLAIALLQYAFVGHVLLALDVAAGIQPNEEMEFQSSVARYDHYLSTHESMRELQQVDKSSEKLSKVTDDKNEERFITSESYHLGVTIKDWDEQRADWLDKNPRMKLTRNGKPRVLIVTGSQPAPCKSPVGDNFHLKALKNKIDYARMHEFEVFYNFAFLDPRFGGVWAKLPILRSLMLTHPEIEWLMWVDSDAVFTDMLFEVPFETFEGYDMVMWSWLHGFKKKDWVSINDGVFFIRNCQWSLDLFDKWSPMGPEGTVRTEAGKFLSSFLTNRQNNFPADDQSALAYVMLVDPEVMSKVKLVEHDFKLHGYWVDIVDHFEEYMQKYHPGLGDCRWPFTTHFTGCSPCSGGNNPNYSYEMCMDNFNRAFNFADNQVLAYFGFQHESLSSHEVIPYRNETAQPLDFVGVNPWKERIEQLAAETTSPSQCW